jgi:hypothetical protein
MASFNVITCMAMYNVERRRPPITVAWNKGLTDWTNANLIDTVFVFTSHSDLA